MTWQLPDGSDGSTGPQTPSLQAAYRWDKEGRMTSMTYPGLNGATGTQYNYGFDAMGRVNQMSQVGGYGGAGAVYGVAGEIDSMGISGSAKHGSTMRCTR